MKTLRVGSLVAASLMLSGKTTVVGTPLSEVQLGHRRAILIGERDHAVLHLPVSSRAAR